MQSSPQYVQADARRNKSEQPSQLGTDLPHSLLQTAVVIRTQHVKQILHGLQLVLNGFSLSLLRLLAVHLCILDCSQYPIAVDEQPDAALQEVEVRLQLLQTVDQFLALLGALILHLQPEGS